MNRDTRLAFIIEDPLADAFKRMCMKKGVSVSGALRELVVKDLRNCDLLPDDFAVALLASA